MPNHPQHKPVGNFEAVSYNERKGTYLRTRHDTPEKAHKRLEGNRRHIMKQVIDHTPPKREPKT